MFLYINLPFIALTFYKQSCLKIIILSFSVLENITHFLQSEIFDFVKSLLKMLWNALGNIRFKKNVWKYLLYILENGNQGHILEHKFQLYGDMLSYLCNVHKCRYTALQNTQMSILQKRKKEKISNKYWITMNKNVEGLCHCCLQKNMSV